MSPQRIPTLCLLVALSAAARADQQAPMQHSPAFEQYKNVPEAAGGKVDERQTSSASLRWQPIPQADHYLVKISRDPGETQVIYTVDTMELTHDTPELTPGAYYFSVLGLQKNRKVGQTTPEPFVIGKPVALNGQRERLDAPTIIGPKHMDLYPTYGYVRLAWVPVDGARGYRFRLWNEDKVRENTRWKRDTPPRWITEIKQPWIEVHDAPYTSFMYLETGTYRWDVAAIDKDGGYIGETAQGYFRTSRQWFLKPNEVFIRASYGYAPNALYSSSSSQTGQGAHFSSTSHRFDTDLDWWLWRQWGLNFTGGLQSLAEHGPTAAASDTLLFIHTSADLLFRTYLSTVPWGWTFTAAAGLGMQEIPLIDQTASNVHAVRPKIWGPHFGLRINKHFDSPWELESRLNILVPALTSGVPDDSTRTNTTLVTDVGVKVVYNWSYHFATELGLGGQIIDSRFTPMPMQTHSNAQLESINVMLGLRFNYFPPPDNTKYYPDKDGAYYPSERPHGYYRSEEKTNNDEYHNDSSSWQRWRTRDND